MTKSQGNFIWYELMSPDPDASKTFYDAVVGWNIDASPAGEIDYRMIVIPGGGNAGGVLRLDAAMQEHGARPMWLGYVGVDDVDAMVAAVNSAGGEVLMPPWTIEGVGRIAMVRDAQGNSFYLMRGASDQTSDAFSVAAVGHCNWNELSTADPDAARAFYGDRFGWTSDDFMPMGEMGNYRFLDHHGVRIGALCGVGPGSTPGWRYYFRVPSINAAVEAINAGGGTVFMGPHEVPGGDHIVIGTDPQGAQFALVGRP